MPLSPTLTSSVFETALSDQSFQFYDFLAIEELPGRHVTVTTEPTGAAPVSVSVDSYSQVVPSPVGRSCSALWHGSGRQSEPDDEK